MSACNSALSDELEAINAIHGEGTVVVTSSCETHTSALLLLSGFPYQFQIRFPAQYPDTPPVLLDIDLLAPNGDRKARRDVSYMRALLFTAHKKGLVCLHDMIEQARSFSASTSVNNSSNNKPSATSQFARDLAQTAYNKCLETESKPTEILDSIAICAACLEPCFKFDAANLSCKHTFCTECLRQALEMTLNGTGNFRCCGMFFPVSVVREYGGLSKEELMAYENWTKDFPYRPRLQCYDKECNTAIYIPLIKGDLVKCPACGKRVCVSCGKRDHKGVCIIDKKLKALIKSEDLRACPACGFLVDRILGCRHMLCQCQTHWCWDCGKIRFLYGMGSRCECDERGIRL